MNHAKHLLAVTFAALLAVFALSGCGPKGEDGDAYMALDWVYAPRYIDFAMLPDVVIAENYYGHPQGVYYAAYVAWDGTFWDFEYTIEVDEGYWGFMDIPGVDGADRYYTLYLYSWGPEMYLLELGKYVAGASRAAAGEPAAEEETARRAELGIEAREARRLRAAEAPPDLSGYDLDAVEPYSFESRGEGWRVSIRGMGYVPQR